MTADLSKLRLAALLGFFAITLGAFGAHGLETGWKASLSVEEFASRVANWKTASLYHMVHAVLLVFLAFVFPTPAKGRWIWRCFVGGILIFSGSLYLLCVTGIKTLGAVTPVGGLLLISGWLLLAMHTNSKKQN